MKTNKFYWVLSSVFLGIYFGIVYENTYNIPRWDDFQVFFNFLCDYVNSSSLVEKFELVFSQHGEHRKLLTRLITLLDYWITGKVNLSTFIVIGNLFLLGIGAMFFVFLRQKKDAGVFVLLTTLLIFNGQNFETSTWAMGGLQDMAITFMAMLSIYFVLQPKNSEFVTGLVLSVVTIFSHGNGLCLLPAVLFSLILQKRKKEIVWFAIVAGIASICYFFNWNMENTSETISLLRRIPIIATSFFHFLGGNLWLPSFKIASFLLGIFVFATYVWAIIGKFYKKNFMWFTFFTFMLLTAAMVALNRPAEEVAPMRYRIHCCMGIMLAVMFYFENREALHLTRWFRWIILPVMLYSIFCTALYLDKCEKFSEYKKVTAYNWQRDKSGLCPNNSQSMEKILQRTEDYHIYTMPKLPLKELASTVAPTEQNWQNHNSHIIYEIDFIEETNEYLLIKGWAYTDEMNMDFTDIFLRMFNDKQDIKIHPYAERRYDLPVNTTIVESCGFFAVVPKAELSPGTYKLGIEIQKRYIMPIKKSAKSMNTEIQIQI